MRVTTFLLYFCFLLFGGKNYASTTSGSTTVTSNFSENIADQKQSSLLNDLSSITVLDDIDLDQEEEFHLDSTSKNSNTFCTTHYSLVTSLYATTLIFSLSDYYKKSAKTFPHLTGNSCPIYLVQRVLRI